MKRELMATLLSILLSTLLTSPAIGEDKKSATAAQQGIKHLNAADSQKLLATNQSVVILDVRTPEEFSAGHITGATNLDFHGTNFDRHLAALDRKKPYLVHCASGKRSGKTLDKMENLNFRTVYHLDGGFIAWEKAGNKVQKP